MKFLTVIFCLASFLPLASFAQVGYLGKRINIQYAPTLGNPWLQNALDGSSLNTTFDSYIIEGAKDYPSYPRYNATSHSKKTTFLNIKHRFLLNYTISSNSTIGLGYNIEKYGFYARDLFIANEDSTQFVQTESSGNIDGTDLILKYTKYNSNTAPIGHYFSVSVGLNKAKKYIIAKDIDGHFKETTVNIPFVGLDVGRNILIGDGLFVNIGVAMQFSQKYLKLENYRTFTYNIFRPTVGIGYIPF